MSKNNNNNNNGSNNNNGGNNNQNNSSSSNDRGRRNNNNSRNNNRNSNGNNNVSNNGGKKGAYEELGHNIFDCGSRKNIKTCEKSLKAMAIHAGTGKDFGREASNLKCVIEHLEDPEVKPPESLSSNDMKNKTLWFI